MPLIVKGTTSRDLAFCDVNITGIPFALAETATASDQMAKASVVAKDVTT